METNVGKAPVLVSRINQWMVGRPLFRVSTNEHDFRVQLGEQGAESRITTLTSGWHEDRSAVVHYHAIEIGYEPPKSETPHGLFDQTDALLTGFLPEVSFDLRWNDTHRYGLLSHLIQADPVTKAFAPETFAEWANTWFEDPANALIQNTSLTGETLISNHFLLKFADEPKIGFLEGHYGKGYEGNFLGECTRPVYLPEASAGSTVGLVEALDKILWPVFGGAVKEFAKRPWDDGMNYGLLRHLYEQQLVQMFEGPLT